MAKQTINLGTPPAGADGDTIRTAFSKSAANFTELYDATADNAITNAKLADVNTATIKGRATAGFGDPEDLTGAQVRTLINVEDGANNYTLADGAVTNAKLADVPTQTIKGRTTAATGDPEDLTAPQVRTLINVEDGATANSTDTFLIDRANHTGTQATSTVAGLDTALAGKQPLADNLTAFAGLTGVADRLPYFTGAGALSLATLTAYARTLLDDPDAATARGTLELGSAATRTALGTTGELYSRDSILGTVSQSGGAPTGAIIESGSNANGSYEKYASGALICSKPPSQFVVIGGGAPAPPFTTSDAITFAAPFVGAKPSVSAEYVGKGSNDKATVFQFNTTLSGCSVAIQLSTSVSGPEYSLTAIGRWY